MTRLLHNLFGDLDRPDTAGQVLFYRVFEGAAVAWAVYFAWLWGVFIQRIEAPVMPAGIARYLDVSFMFDHGISLGVAAAITALAVLGLTRTWRYAYLAMLLMMHLQYVSRFILGKVSHGSSLAGLVLVALAIGTLAFSDRQQVRRFVLGFCIFFFGFGYVLAAACKLIGTGPLWSDGLHLWMWIGERTVDRLSETGAIQHTFLQSLALTSHPLATAMLTFGLVAEALGFLLWYRRTRHVMAFILLSMHLGVLFSMQIRFPVNETMMLLLAAPWAGWADQALTRWGGTRGAGLQQWFLRHA
ncbi:MAG: hypothetical protein AAF730_04555 [Bacteroidota bacterium]